MVASFAGSAVWKMSLRLLNHRAGLRLHGRKPALLLVAMNFRGPQALKPPPRLLPAWRGFALEMHFESILELEWIQGLARGVKAEQRIERGDGAF